MGKALQGEKVFQLPVHAYIVKIGYIGNFRSFRGFSRLLFSKMRLTEIKKLNYLNDIL